MTSRIFGLLFLCLFIASTSIVSFGSNVGSQTQIEFLPQTQLPVDVWDFCVTNDELFILPDFAEGNIKIYQKKYDPLKKKVLLELIKTIGYKGRGPEGLIKPSFCFYNESEDRFGVLDVGLRKIVFYSRLVERDDFRREEMEVLLPDLAYDIQLNVKSFYKEGELLQEDKLYVLGYKEDSNKKSYSFFSVNLNDNKETLLLPSKDFYDLKGEGSFSDLFGQNYIPAIGFMGSFDIQNDVAYIVWEGNLRIKKVNLLDEQILPPFVDESGTISKRYKKPFTSQELVDAYYNKMDGSSARKIKQEQMSVVRKVFTTNSSVIVIYEGPTKFDKEPRMIDLWINFYTLEGSFNGEVYLGKSQPDSRMYFNKGSKTLYLLPKSSDKRKGQFFLSEYRIIE
jgi:hypothetical protein